MTERPRVRDIMARNLVTLTPDMAINRAAAVLLDKKISGAPVVDTHGDLVGVLSKKDCMAAALHASYYRDWGGSVAEYMSQDVETLDADMDIVAAGEAFLASKFRRFPVMEAGALVGQVSRADILTALHENWS